MNIAPSIRKDLELLMWIEAVLSNDEVSTDEELIELFVTEGGMSLMDATLWVEQRGDYVKDRTP